MKHMISLTVTISMVLLAVASLATADVPTLMQYQGFLTDAEGEALNDTLSITFTIYDAPFEGAVWWTETQPEVVVSNGLFNVLLGSVNPIVDTVFAETQRWLGITVAPDPEIVPRTRLVTVPYAFRVATLDLATGGLIFGTIDADGFSINGVPVGTSTDSYWSAAGSDIYYNLGNVGIGTAFPSEALDVEGNIHAGGTITSGSSITIDGNNDRITATSGTIDFDDENIVTTGKATIGPGHTNTGLYAFVAGMSNIATGELATVGGGFSNTASEPWATVGGGAFNTASGYAATVSGGSSNGARGSFSFVGGGGGMTMADSNAAIGDYSVVVGGRYNYASGAWSTVGGGNANETNDTFAVVGGGWGNHAQSRGATVSGGEINLAYGYASTISGGAANITDGPVVTISGGYLNIGRDTCATIGGGWYNVVEGKYSAILGGYADTITASADYSYLFGIGSKLTEDSTFMVNMPHIRFGDETQGYEFPTTDGADGQVMATNGDGQLSWVDVSGGGGKWSVTDTVLYTNNFWGIARGGASNLVDNTEGFAHTMVNFGVACTTRGKHMIDPGDYATVSGGYGNVVESSVGTVGGGMSNTVSGLWGTVGGGAQNSVYGDGCAVGGGILNQVNGNYSVVAGGSDNVVDGIYSAILGGFGDTITFSADYSYLFGIGSRLDEDSTFMVDMPHIFFQGEIWLADSAGDTTSLLSGFPGGGGFIGTMGANRSNNTGLTYVGGYPNKGALGVMDGNSDWKASMIVSTAYDVGMVYTRGPNGNRNSRLTYTLGYPNHGCVSITDSLEQDRGHFFVDDSAAGRLTLLGPNNTYNVVLRSVEDDPNRGSMGVCDTNGWMRAEMLANDGNSGTLYLLDPNNYYNVYIGNMPDGYNRGQIIVCDGVGISQAGMEVNASGQGIVWGDTKNFRMPNPNEPGTDIWYCCLEGPEAAAYVRGTGHLESGRAQIALPDHFVAVASQQGITVQVTPLSAESKGLAVVEKSSEMFAVRELNNGNGTYDFDFMVTAVRKAHEDYQVIRPAMKMQPPELGAAPGAATGGAPDGSDIQLQKLSR